LNGRSTASRETWRLGVLVEAASPGGALPLRRAGTLAQRRAGAAATWHPKEGSGLERLTRLLMDLGVTHPLPVRRTHELMRWVRGGDYDRIVGGDYVRRGEPADPRAEGGEAAAFYPERFRRAFREAGDAVGSMGDQLAGWLRRDGDDDEPGA